MLISFSATAQQKDLYKNKDTGVKAKPVKKVNGSSTKSISDLNKELRNENKNIEGVYKIVWVKEDSRRTDTYYKYFQKEGETDTKMWEQVNLRYKDYLKEGQKLELTTTIHKGNCIIIYTQNRNGINNYLYQTVTSDYVKKKVSHIKKNPNNNIIEKNLCSN